MMGNNSGHWVADDMGRHAEREEPQVVLVRRVAVNVKGGAPLPLPPAVKVMPAGAKAAEGWAPGALALGGTTRGRVIYCTLGKACVDPGTDCSFTTREIAEAYPGGKIVELDEEVEVSAPEGWGTATFVATHAVDLEMTIQWSVDTGDRGSAAGLRPTVRECGFPLRLLICEDGAVLRHWEAGHVDLGVVLGEDAQRAPGAYAFFAAYVVAKTDNVGVYRPTWTHSQRTSLQGVVHGAEKSLAQDLAPAAVAFDVPDPNDDELPYGPRSPFLLDTELDLVEEREFKYSTPDRGESKIPTTVDGMMAYLEEKLRKKGRVVTKYLRELAEIFLRQRRALLEPRPSEEAPPLVAKVEAGASPTREGLWRHVPKEALEGLNEEVRKLMEHKMVGEVAAAPGGGPPADLWINGLVVTLRRPPPGSPPEAKRKVRMCIDSKPANKYARAMFETQLPNLEEHVGSTDGQSLWTTLDSPNAYHQCRMDEKSTNLFGFVLPDMDGRVRYYKYLGAPFGFRDFPALFQERMREVIAGAQGVEGSTCRAFLDDVAIGSGRHGQRLDDVWGTEREREVVLSHLRCLEATLAGYVRFGMVGPN